MVKKGSFLTLFGPIFGPFLTPFFSKSVGILIGFCKKTDFLGYLKNDHFLITFSKIYDFPLVFLMFDRKLMKNLVFFNMCLAKCTTVQAKIKVKITEYQFFNRKCSKMNTTADPAGPPDPADPPETGHGRQVGP